jgi:hypothetical protein
LPWAVRSALFAGAEEKNQRGEKRRLAMRASTDASEQESVWEDRRHGCVSRTRKLENWWRGKEMGKSWWRGEKPRPMFLAVKV